MVVAAAACCVCVRLQTKSGKSLVLEDYLLLAEPMARANSFVGTEVRPPGSKERERRAAR